MLYWCIAVIPSFSQWKTRVYLWNWFLVDLKDLICHKTRTERKCCCRDTYRSSKILLSKLNKTDRVWWERNWIIIQCCQISAKNHNCAVTSTHLPWYTLAFLLPSVGSVPHFLIGYFTGCQAVLVGFLWSSGNSWVMTECWSTPPLFISAYLFSSCSIAGVCHLLLWSCVRWKCHYLIRSVAPPSSHLMFLCVRDGHEFMSFQCLGVIRYKLALE